ncbi:MAG: hypothetical protein DRG82_04450 [Deltaproteobacteria bacterium]|nr:MAG: hypothetical protein DRG82_04450 [Deltaproteobacteria bacterium]
MYEKGHGKFFVTFFIAQSEAPSMHGSEKWCSAVRKIKMLRGGAGNQAMLEATFLEIGIC